MTRSTRLLLLLVPTALVSLVLTGCAIGASDVSSPAASTSSSSSSGTTGAAVTSDGDPGKNPDAADISGGVAAFSKDMVKHDGFVPLLWDEAAGQVYLVIERFDEEFLYVESLAAGIGSNDIGLDRGQLGSQQVVEFRRVGKKVLLVAKNQRYRAQTDDALERRSVEEAFAQSVLWGFTVAAEDDASAGGAVVVDATEFVLRDAHNVVGRLKGTDQGTYRLDSSRSALYPERIKAFPKNTELEGTLTFTGTPSGGWIRSVTPSPDAVTVRQHHSLIELPPLHGPGSYRPRAFDSRSGFIPTSFLDYSQPISENIVQRYALRHRLEKTDSSAAVSDVKEPIVYYLDSGTPEPIRSALLEGAGWWAQAFEAAGFRNAFRVEMLPADADPLDVRYNVIQWVHRSTRGWSYGSSIRDPRTGEILKGHVSLGSLRVRQDFLIAESLLGPYGDSGTVPEAMQEMALARLRQLSAHEIGHTIGLTHNFASSVDGRASVMDYPHPLVTLQSDGTVVLSDAYDVGIGAWDKRALTWGYSQFAPGIDEHQALERILAETQAQGLRFISDRDARPSGGAHPLAHLWDNGASASVELDRLLQVRRAALDRFGERNIRQGTSLSMLENTLVPLYLLHRYQIEGAAKIVGGLDYNYAYRGDEQTPTALLTPGEQYAALDSLLATLQPTQLVLPEKLLQIMPPKAEGLSRGRENFPSRTGLTFDPLSAAEVAATMTVSMLLDPQRASRLVIHHARDAQQPSLLSVLDRLVDSTWKRGGAKGMQAEVKRVVDGVVLDHLQELASSKRASIQARAQALIVLEELADWLKSERSHEREERAHRRLAARSIRLFLDQPDIKQPRSELAAPDGSPIGMDSMEQLISLPLGDAFRSGGGLFGEDQQDCGFSR